jgi:hypothetical protein
VQSIALQCEEVQIGLQGEELRREQPVISSPAECASGASECEAMREARASFAQAEEPLLDCLSPDLARVVDAWDGLPLHIRTSILALVDAAAPRAEGGAR